MARFDVIGEFVPSTPCLSGCGEYPQYVRGTYMENGEPVTYPLRPGGIWIRTPSRKTVTRALRISLRGCRFEGHDRPAISGYRGETIAQVMPQHRPSCNGTLTVHQQPGKQVAHRVIFDGHGGAKTAERCDKGHSIRDV